MITDFMREVRKQILRDSSKKLKVVGYGKDDYFLGYATNTKELIRLLKNKKLSGIITDNTPKGSVCYNFKDEVITINENVLTESDIIEYETEQLLLAGGISAKDMESEIISNNMFVGYMAKVFSEKEDLVNLNQIYVRYSKYKSLPLFHSLTIKSDGLDLCVTKHQMSILTGSGLVKVHDTNRNIDAYELSKLINNLFKTSKKTLYEAFNTIDNVKEFGIV